MGRRVPGHTMDNAVLYISISEIQVLLYVAKCRYRISLMDLRHAIPVIGFVARCCAQGAHLPHFTPWIKSMCLTSGFGCDVRARN